MNPEAENSNLSAAVASVWVRKWLILLVVIAATVLTYVYSNGQDRVYRASTQVFVEASQLDQLLSSAQNFGTDRNVQNQARLLESRGTADAVSQRITVPGGAEALRTAISSTASAGADFVVVSAKWGDPRLATSIANAFADEFVRRRSADLRGQITDALSAARRQLARIPEGPSNATQRQTALATIRQLELAQTLPSSNAQRVDPATVPTRPVSPRPRRAALFAFGLSLLLMVAVALGLDRFDRRLKRVEDITKHFGSVLLTALPHTRNPTMQDEHGAVLPPELKESFRGLRTNLALASIDEPLKVLVVTSAIPGEGKSMVARNLALAYREWGQSVAVVDADLRRPTLPGLFGVEAEGVGFTGVLTGEQPLEAALHDVPVSVEGLETLERIRGGATPGDSVTNGAAPGERTGRLSLLAAGETPANPQAVLAARRATEIIDELTKTHDIVIVDTPPLLAVSDAVPLVEHADGVLVVARIGLTTRDAVGRLVETMSRIPNANWLGIVANDLAEFGRSEYAYGYGYAAKPRATSKA